MVKDQSALTETRERTGEMAQEFKVPTTKLDDLRSSTMKREVTPSYPLTFPAYKLTVPPHSPLSTYTVTNRESNKYK